MEASIFVSFGRKYKILSSDAHSSEENLQAVMGYSDDKRLAKEAEKYQASHQWRDEFGNNDIIYYNAKDDQNDPEKNETESGSQRIRPVFEDDPVFRRQTSYQHAAVHIPTDIYEGSTIVLNELNWTAALDDVFGSATGLARYYPASPWVDKSRTPNKIDLYIQGAASPKDMLILVDASGSVSGLTLKLIRTSVIEMLETLSDDDFFNNNAQNVSCFNHLVQANVRNKKKLKEAVYKISAKGITDYKKGFSYAFEQLLNHSVSRANCNKIIMLFTDGGEERAQEIFHKYNEDKKVRVFTFSVGQHNYDKGPIQWMACENKGYYYEIPSIGAIRINTQEYLDVLGRPMVLAGEQAKQVQWTNELGLVITGTLPVFNLTREQNGKINQLILGVMGVDVSLEDIKKLTPRFTLCPNGYYFAIDPNGYVLLHPNLQPKQIGVGIPKVKLRKRRPNNPKSQEPVTLDFLDAELENDIKIRKKMIDGESGEKTFETLVKSQDERYIDKGNRTYTWTAVNGTDYSLALVLPSYSFYYIKAKIDEPIIQARCKYCKDSLLLSGIAKTQIHLKSNSLKLDDFDEAGYTFLAPREYCSDVKKSENNTEFLLNFNEFIDRNTPSSSSCNTDMVIRVLLDAGFTSELAQNYWSKLSLDGVVAQFVVTDGGITRVFPKRAGEDWLENAETYEISFYKRSLDNDNYIFTAPYYNKSGANSYESGIMVSKAVEIEVDGKLLKPAVVGIKIDATSWMENFTKTTIKSLHVDCVILDDGGFLLMSNRDEYTQQIGRFFGEIDPGLMRNLINMSLYAFNKSYDYQSVCDPEEEPKQGAGLRSAYPTITDILQLGWWASAAAWSILQQLFLSLTFPRFLEAADMEDDDFGAALPKTSCITEQTQYFFENNDKSFGGIVDCINCSRLYHAEKISNTNLVFIIRGFG
ncbi:hypothetical protein IHE44_0012602 [Lamprotornis superbus]|uniref:VWFA domain-containing protein n=1 Tax=Lamprotornis superbus TaxID=245042 RepID=A0A835U237_9PASS|nr:hypothetical protein IHE44_0012602 [Lamprotornis superbus]